MNIKNFALSTLAVFIFVFALEWLLHGVLLMGLYEQTMHLWRPEEEMCCFWMWGCQLLFSGIFTYIFSMNYEGKGIAEGVRYGFWIGLLLGSIQLATYAYMPIPLVLTLAWVGGMIVKGIGGGVVLSLVYKK